MFRTLNHLMKILILLEVFTYAHEKVDKLSGQLLLDVALASRLSGVLKRRYLDYLAQMKLNLNRPGFDSLRKFIAHELSVMTSDNVQAFFKHGEKDTGKSSDNGGKRDFVRVRQAAENSGKDRTNSLPSNNRDFKRRKSSPIHAKPPPLCFICHSSDSTV